MGNRICEAFLYLQDIQDIICSEDWNRMSQAWVGTADLGGDGQYVYLSDNSPLDTWSELWSVPPDPSNIGYCVKLVAEGLVAAHCQLELPFIGQI